jgi:hypothetical protein
MTYHPLRIGGLAWSAYHSVAYVLALALLVVFRQHWVAVTSALWPDFDWVFRPLHLPFWSEGMLHRFAWKVPFIQTLQEFATAHLPDWRGHVVAGIPELLVSGMIAWVLFRREQARTALVRVAASAPQQTA